MSLWKQPHLYVEHFRIPGDPGVYASYEIPAIIFYGQCHEDFIVYSDFIANNLAMFQNTGTYIEVGASNGVKFSNTKFFEENLGFTGMLVEPHIGFFDVLEKSRPNNYLFRCAVGIEEKPAEFLVKGYKSLPQGFVSGLAHTMSEEHKERWFQDEFETVFVDVKKMSTLMHRTSLKYVDIFSIDVEGAEWEVLSTVDWDIPIYIMIIELASGDSFTEKSIQCQKLLVEQGFKFHKRAGLSEIWYNDENLQKRNQIIKSKI